MSLRIVVLQGPNLTWLGVRRPEIYGTRTLAEIQDAMDLSNVHAREQWRRHDVYAEITNLYIAGLGCRGYVA